MERMEEEEEKVFDEESAHQNARRDASTEK
jgi:hypothetical protein